MKKMRIPIIVAWAIAVVGVILGSFFDLNISSAIASADNFPGLLISAIGPMIGFMGVSVMGGGLVALAVHGKYHVVLKVFMYIFAAACFGVAVHYPAQEWFGVNGFEGQAPMIVGYLIVLLPEAAAGVGGYFLFKDCKNPNMWIVFFIIIGLLTLILVAILPIIKDTVRRPRFRIISKYGIEFHNWWEPCKNYKDLMTQYGITNSDHFKSFPSGHTAEASILLVVATFFPLANEKLEKYQLPLFIGGGVLTLIVAFARILAAAHFLSDVSMGATVMLTLLFIANEVVMKIKALQLKKE